MSIDHRFPVIMKNLSWCYGDKKILNDINLTIEKNKFYSIIGPNGSGKTTLLKNMSRVLEPRKNSVFINDLDITNLKNRDIARKVSCVPQNTNVDFDFSAHDIVLMGRNPYMKRLQNESREDLEIVRNAMLATNTWHLQDKNINETSGGERQRIIIARALAQDTGIMLLDEPVSQLDIHHQIELMETVKSLISIRGITVVAVMHDLNLAAEYSDYLILLNDGGIAAQGTPEQVLTESIIKNVYNLEVYIMKNPVTGKPHLIPIKGNCAQQSAS